MIFIEGLLKDYIRELPEPLFTKALFDMMDDGLSVCLPDDPSGNAKLMFSILECLPKTNRMTVLFLMDHLKRIVSRADRNKMSSQAIAICFGPLFTCHSESENLHKPIEVFKFLLEIWPQRRGSASRSASNDSMLSGKALISKGSTVGKLDSSATAISSHPISSIVQTSIASLAMTTTSTSTSTLTYSHLPPISISSTVSSSLLPALTPGPSPTALTISEAPNTSSVPTTSTIVTSAGANPEFVHPSVSTVPTTKKSVAFAQQNNNSNNSSGSGPMIGPTGVGVSGSGTSIQSRALPFPPKC